MDLGDPSDSWVPIWDGVVLPKFEPYEEMVADEVAPFGGKDPAWTKTTTFNELKNVPLGRDAIWQTVLALYRLKELESRETKGRIWQKLVLAWLVSDVRFFPAKTWRRADERRLGCSIVMSRSVGNTRSNRCSLSATSRYI